MQGLLMAFVLATICLGSHGCQDQQQLIRDAERESLIRPPRNISHDLSDWPTQNRRD